MTDVVEQSQPDGTLLLCHPTKPWSLAWDPNTKVFQSTSDRVTVFCNPEADHWFSVSAKPITMSFYEQGRFSSREFVLPDVKEEAAWMEQVVSRYGAVNSIQRHTTILNGQTSLVEPCMTFEGAPGLHFTNLDTNSCFATRTAYGDEWRTLGGEENWVKAVQEYAKTHYPMEEKND